MASGSGSWSPTTGGGNRGRLEWQIDQSPSKVGAGTSSVSLRLRVWYRSRYSISDSSNSYSISGSWSGSGSRSISHGGSGGRTLLFDSTITVSTSYAGTVSRNFTAKFTGINATPNIPNVSRTHTVGRRPVSAPNTPSWDETDHTSATRAVIRWGASSTTARPIKNFRVEMQRFSTGKWTIVATPSAGARSYTRTGLPQNDRVRFRVRAQGDGGNSGWATGGWISTTPAAPTMQGAVKRANGDIEVAFTDRAQDTDRPRTFIVEGRQGSGDWVQVGTTSSAPFTHSDPDPSQPWAYRVAARITSQLTLTSGWSAVSNTVQLLAPPDAPTPLTPQGVVDRDQDVVFTWQHNSVDTTEQTAYELRWRWKGAGWATLSGTTSESRTVSALGQSGTVEWQVRTKGDHVDWSDWSPIGSFQLEAAPTVAINEPFGGTLAQSRVDVVLGYDQVDGSPQSRATVELIHDGVTVETLNLGKADTGQFRYALDNETEYTVRARVQAANGLWSEWDEVTFSTDFPRPVPHEVEAEWDRSAGAVTLVGVPSGPPTTYEWGGEPHESVSVKSTESTTVTNVATNPIFGAAGREIVIHENLIPYARPSVSTAMYASTSTSGVASGDDYREIEFTADVSGGTMFFRSGAANGFEGVSLGESYTGRIGVTNVSPYPVSLRAGLIRKTGATLGIASTYSDDTEISAGEYVEIETGTATIDENWDTVRLGLLASSGGVIPEGTRLRIYDGVTVNRGTTCARLVHPYMEDEGDGIYGVSYGVRGTSPSALVGRAVDGVPQTADLAAIQAASDTFGTRLHVVPRGDHFGVGLLGTFATAVQPLTEGLDYTVTNTTGATLPGVVVMSFHGGDSDVGTSEPAHEIAGLLGASLYDLDGHVRPELGVGTTYANLHLPSDRFDDPRLTDLTWASDYAVSIHGAFDVQDGGSYPPPGSGAGIPYTFVGGLHDELGEAIATSLRSAGFLCSTEKVLFPGISGVGARNPIQLTRSGRGVQLEISGSQRESFYQNGSTARPDRAHPTATFYAYTQAVADGITAYLGGL